MTTANNNFHNTAHAEAWATYYGETANDDNNKNYQDECYSEVTWAKAWFRVRDFYINRGGRRHAEVMGMLRDHPEVIRDVVDSKPSEEEIDAVGWSIVGRVLLRVA
jgi:hypothetical protein